MAEKKGFSEKGLETYRNFNIFAAIGTAVVGIVSTLPETKAFMAVATAFNVAQAGIAEVIRRGRKGSASPQAAPAR